MTRPFSSLNPRLLAALLSSVLLAPLFLVGCAHFHPATGLKSRITPEQLFSETCSPGQSLQQAKGGVWLKIRSHEGSGQFSGNVRVQAPGFLELEILQPLGGVWATVTVRGGESYEIDVAGKPEQNRKGRGFWAGIPLRFSTDLFLGRVPCPSLSAMKGHIPKIDDQDELVLELSAERYFYSFRENEGSFWPESLHWESLFQGKDSTLPVAADFKFEDPEKNTRSPLKWEAKSSRGEIKVRWRDRQTVPGA